MRVLHVITGLNKGGAEGQMFRLIKYLNCKNQAEFIVLSLMNGGYYYDELTKLGVEVYYLYDPSSPIMSVIKTIKRIRDCKPDIVQTWMYHSDLIGSFVKVLFVNNAKLVWNIRHGDVLMTDKRLRKKFLVYLLSKLSHFIPDKIISCSDMSTHKHIEYGYCARKFTTIHNGYFVPESYTCCNNGANKFTFLCVARLDRLKNHLFIAEVVIKFAQLNSSQLFDLIFVGRGVDQLSAELVHNSPPNLNINCYDHHDELDDVYSKSNLLILASETEGFPNVVAEAGINGTVSIVRDVGAASNIVPYTCLTVEFSLNSYLDAIRMIYELFQNNDLGCLSELAYMHICRNFSIDVAAENYTKLWNSVR